MKSRDAFQSVQVKLNPQGILLLLGSVFFIVQTLLVAMLVSGATSVQLSLFARGFYALAGFYALGSLFAWACSRGFVTLPSWTRMSVLLIASMLLGAGLYLTCYFLYLSNISDKPFAHVVTGWVAGCPAIFFGGWWFFVFKRFYQEGQGKVSSVFKGRPSPGVFVLAILFLVGGVLNVWQSSANLRHYEAIQIYQQNAEQLHLPQSGSSQVQSRTIIKQFASLQAHFLNTKAFRISVTMNALLGILSVFIALGLFFKRFWARRLALWHAPIQTINVLVWSFGPIRSILGIFMKALEVSWDKGLPDLVLWSNMMVTGLSLLLVWKIVLQVLWMFGVIWFLTRPQIKAQFLSEKEDLFRQLIQG